MYVACIWGGWLFVLMDGAPAAPHQDDKQEEQAHPNGEGKARAVELMRMRVGGEGGGVIWGERTACGQNARAGKVTPRAGALVLVPCLLSSRTERPPPSPPPAHRMTTSRTSSSCSAPRLKSLETQRT